VTLPVEGRSQELWLSFVAVRAREGVVVYAFRDMTAERQLEESKDDFVATVSHELRTPMTAVLGAAKTLLREDVELSDRTIRQLLEMIVTQSTRLAQVTQSVLLAGSLDRDEVSFAADQVDVSELVHETIDALAGTIPRSVSVSDEARAGGTVIGDRNRLQQVLMNLLDNAVKYSPDGGAVVVRTARDGDRMRLEVEDHGIGIAAGDSDRIFEKFDRGDPSHRPPAGGTGLGLYICRELVERMGGRISVRSAVGAGSTFSVELPAAP